MTDTMGRDAVISDCGKYRYLLRRAWNHDRMRVLFIMLNPSTADAEVDDATIRSCTRLYKSWGYGSFEVVNLFAWRATKPADLADAPNPVGPGNDGFIASATTRCDTPICAWGANWMAGGRARHVFEIINSHRPAAFCLGRTKSGAPRHPLYIKTGTMPEAYRP